MRKSDRVAEAGAWLLENGHRAVLALTGGRFPRTVMGMLSIELHTVGRKSGRPYANLMNSVLGQVGFDAGDFRHPLMEKREGDRRALIVVSTDKGLCGGLNSNLMREAANAASLEGCTATMSQQPGRRPSRHFPFPRRKGKRTSG